MNNDVSHRRMRMILRISGLVLWCAVFAALFFLWRARQQSADDGEAKRLGSPAAAAFVPYEAPDFELIERSGRTVTKADLLGRPWAVSFVFSRCVFECQDIAEQMRRLQSDLEGTGARLVSITVDPQFDTPERLRDYAEHHRAEADRWLFLTGKKETVHELVRDGFKLAVMENTGEDRRPGREVTHSQAVLHVDAAGRVVGKYDGTDPREMLRLRTALREECRRLSRRDGLQINN